MNKNFFVELLFLSFFVIFNVFGSQKPSDIEQKFAECDKLVVFNHRISFEGLTAEYGKSDNFNIINKCNISWFERDTFCRVVNINPSSDIGSGLSLMKSYEQLISHDGREQVNSFPLPVSFLYENGKLKDKIVLAGKELKVVQYDFSKDIDSAQVDLENFNLHGSVKLVPMTEDQKREYQEKRQAEEAGRFAQEFRKDRTPEKLEQLKKKVLYWRMALAAGIAFNVALLACWLCKDTPMFQEMMQQIFGKLRLSNNA